MQPFCTPWKHQYTLRFSDVFRGYIKGALGTNGLRDSWTFFITLMIICLFHHNTIVNNVLFIDCTPFRLIKMDIFTQTLFCIYFIYVIPRFLETGKHGCANKVKKSIQYTWTQYTLSNISNPLITTSLFQSIIIRAITSQMLISWPLLLQIKVFLKVQIISKKNPKSNQISRKIQYWNYCVIYAEVATEGVL